MFAVQPLGTFEKSRKNIMAELNVKMQKDRQIYQKITSKMMRKTNRDYIWIRQLLLDRY